MAPASTCSITQLQNALRDFLTWRAQNLNAPLDELWHVYDSTLREIWQPFSASWLALRIASPQRAPLAAACAQMARARMWYLPFPPLDENALETKLWEVAFALEAQNKTSRDWEMAGGYLSPAHRLADLYRRAGRSDADAVALLIETNAQSFSNEGAGAHHQAQQLIYQGAHITDVEPTGIDDMRVRLGLCYRLKLHDYAAAWVQNSVEAGQLRLRQGQGAQNTQAVLNRPLS